jgi:hypothetical protein
MAAFRGHSLICEILNTALTSHMIEHPGGPCELFPLFSDSTQCTEVLQAPLFVTRHRFCFNDIRLKIDFFPRTKRISMFCTLKK